MSVVAETLCSQRPIAVIGGAVGDVVLAVERLPLSGEDIVAQDRGQQIGGCAFNVARALSRLQVEMINGIAVGDGPWAQQIEQAMQQLHLPVLLRHQQQDNGWCLALTENDGERTFISVMGCEAQWSAQLLAQLPLASDVIVYVNGYELVGSGGAPLRQWLLDLPAQQWRVVDLGPRLVDLPPSFIDQLCQKNTLLTLNRDEIQALCGAGDPLSCLQQFIEPYQLTAIARLDKEGAWLCQAGQAAEHVGIESVKLVDTIGAGDAHCAGLLAGLSANWSLSQSLCLANQVAGFTVEHVGAATTPTWSQLQQRFA